LAQSHSTVLLKGCQFGMIEIFFQGLHRFPFLVTVKEMR
jgi:hypothetical protein